MFVRRACVADDNGQIRSSFLARSNVCHAIIAEVFLPLLVYRSLTSRNTSGTVEAVYSWRVTRPLSLSPPVAVSPESGFLTGGATWFLGARFCQQATVVVIQSALLTRSANTSRGRPLF